MSIAENYLAELKQEAATTRKILKIVPLEKGDWKPHVKNFSLLQLASHVAELPNYLYTTISTDELDFAKSNYKPSTPTSSEELLSIFEKNLKNAEEALSGCSSPGNRRSRESKRNTLLTHHYQIRLSGSFAVRLFTELFYIIISLS